jgi:hypothetical protein
LLHEPLAFAKFMRDHKNSPSPRETYKIQDTCGQKSSEGCCRITWCNVVVTVRGRQMLLKCSHFKQAAKWAGNSKVPCIINVVGQRHLQPALEAYRSEVRPPHKRVPKLT